MSEVFHDFQVHHLYLCALVILYLFRYDSDSDDN